VVLRLSPSALDGVRLSVQTAASGAVTGPISQVERAAQARTRIDLPARATVLSLRLQTTGLMVASTQVLGGGDAARLERRQLHFQSGLTVADDAPLFPIFDLQIRNALELAGVVGDEDQVSGQGLPSDQDVVGPYGRTAGRQGGTQSPRAARIFPVERQHLEAQSLAPGQLHGLAPTLVGTEEQCMRNDRRQAEIHRLVLPQARQTTRLALHQGDQRVAG
jgi:hypothetical protein